jgi:muramidase (phage lysozyme)
VPRIGPNEANDNVRAFLDTIAYSEIGPELLALSDDGYNVIVGSTAKKPILFGSYEKHPRSREWIDFNRDGNVDSGEFSDAAGRYQFMGRYWEPYRKQLHLDDFGPISQDRWALQLIRECRAMALVAAGRFDAAVTACRSRWASLPGANYGQHENGIDALRAAYLNAGGALA